MKKIFLLFIALSCLAYSQTQINTQDVNTRYKYYSAATTGDTLVLNSAAASGSSIPYSPYRAFIVGVLVGNPIARDTITILNGVGTVATIITPYQDTLPRYYQLGARLDTSLIIVKKKASGTTVFFQTQRMN